MTMNHTYPAEPKYHKQNSEDNNFAVNIVVWYNGSGVNNLRNHGKNLLIDSLKIIKNNGNTGPC